MSLYALDTKPISLNDYLARIGSNLDAYFIRLPETILYMSYWEPSQVFAVLCLLIVGYGFFYCLFKKRTLLEYYLAFYAAILLVYQRINVANDQRYLVPLIPIILYHFMRGLEQICVRISDLLDARLDFSTVNNPQPLVQSAFRTARRVSLAMIGLFISLNLISTVQASVVKTQPEMFDFYRYYDNFEEFKDMALWTKQHTPPQSTIMTRFTYFYHVWSQRQVYGYPAIEIGMSRERLAQNLTRMGADYIALDSPKHDRTAADQLLREVVQQSPQAFQRVYQNGDNHLYRVRARL